MTSKDIRNCIIIGSGPAGYTAAIYAARANMKPLLFTGADPGGQLMITTEVENYPGYPDGVRGPEMMADFQKQAERFETEVRYEHIGKVDLTGDVKKVITEGGEEFLTHSVLISTGASAKWLNVKGEQEFMNRGVSACAVCDGFFFKGQDVVVVGGGDTACEEASYLSKVCGDVHMLVRRDEMKASKIMQKRVLKTKNIHVHWNSETEEILGDEKGVNKVRIKNNQSGETTDLDVTGFFVAIGHKPNTDIFKGVIDMDELGYINTIPGTSKTNVEGVFACGDAQDSVYRQAVTAAGTGCMAALDSERYLTEKEII